MEDTVFLSVLILGCTALIATVVLYLVSRKFAVSEDARVAEIEAVLPQANCGGCGRAGCHDFAVSCAAADDAGFAELYCPVGGAEVMSKVAAIMGREIAEKKPTAAVLRCNGSCQNAPQKVNFDGICSCRVAARISVGQTGCPNGCLRLGDCVSVCKFGALSLDPLTGIPVVDYDKCTSCGACVRICPRGLFEIRSRGDNGQMVYVACRNTQKGAVARKNCKAACIGCMKCAKISSDIKVENNLSYIPDSVSAAEFGEQLQGACPTSAIIYHRNGEKA